jgi:nucleoside-diphosphate-sugar epimerase
MWVERLAQRGHEILCLVRPTSNVGKIKNHGANLITGDVTHKTSVLAGMRGCDWVFRLANVNSFWEPNERIYQEVNVEGTRIVLEAALGWPVGVQSTMSLTRNRAKWSV